MRVHGDGMRVHGDGMRVHGDGMNMVCVQLLLDKCNNLT